MDADEVLTTTRAVRKRLDLERPLADEVLLRLIDLQDPRRRREHVGACRHF